jgi:gliding motility-associated-like protein
VTLYGLPDVNLGSDTVICFENSVLLYAGEFEQYFWSTGETTDAIRVYAGPKTIHVTVTDEVGCQGRDTISILPCDPLRLLDPITNAFTPNNDKVHDTWELKNIEMFPDASIKVYDRWGRIVLNVDGGYENDWDGTSNGKELPMDTYYFIIELDSSSDPITGTVTIIR